MSGAAPQPGDMYLTGRSLLDCAATALGTTAAGTPPRVCFVVGAELPWDNCQCGSLTVHVPRSYPSEHFPDAKVVGPFKDCTTPFTVVEYVLTVLRCVPQSDDAGNPPSCDAVELAAATDMDDRTAVLWGTQCCLQQRMHMVGDQLGLGESGTCAGSELHVFVPLSNCWPCPDGMF